MNTLKIRFYDDNWYRILEQPEREFRTFEYGDIDIRSCSFPDTERYTLWLRGTNTRQDEHACRIYSGHLKALEEFCIHKSWEFVISF